MRVLHTGSLFEIGGFMVPLLKDAIQVMIHLHSYFLLALLLVALLCVRLVPKFGGAFTHWYGRLKADIAVMGGASLICALFALSMVGYLLYPSYFDHAEPLMAATSWLVMQGLPAHPLWAQGEGLYGVLYGPFLYEVLSLPLTLLPTIAGAKIVGLTFTALAVVIQYTTFRKMFADWRLQVLLTALSVVVFATDSYMISERPDPIIYMMGSLCIYALLFNRPLASAIIIGVSAGLATNMKIHGFLYFLPASVALIAQQKSLAQRIRYGQTGILCGLAAALLPFALPNTGLDRFATYILMATRHGIDPVLFLDSLVTAVSLLALPAFCYAILRPRLTASDTAFAWTLAGALFAVSIIAGKPGAGPHHLLLFLPAVAFAVARILSASGNADAAMKPSGALRLLFLPLLATFGFTALAISGHYVRIFFGEAHIAQERLVELQNFSNQYPDAQMGVTDDARYPETFQFPAMVFSGNRLYFSVAAWMDLKQSGLDPHYAIDLVKQCRVREWILPSAGEPFTLLSWYTFQPLLPDAFRDNFRRNYSVVQKGEFFNVWSCAPKERS
jgi:hypothetical protein